MPVRSQKNIHNIAPWLRVFQPLLAEKIFEDANFILHSRLAFLTGGQPYCFCPERSLDLNIAIVLNIWRVVNSTGHSASAAPRHQPLCLAPWYPHRRQLYCVTMPPSTDMACPVTNDAASEHSQTTASATSSGVPRRPTGSSSLSRASARGRSPSKR